MNRFLFGEGKTEALVMKKLIRQFFPSNSLEVLETGGRDRQFQEIQNIIEPRLPNGFGCLVLLDKDREDSENYDSIRSAQQRWSHWVQDMLSGNAFETNVSFDIHHQYHNILRYRTPPELPDIQFVLHVARSPAIPDLQGYPFHNAATDDYILALALTERVLNRFAEQAHIAAHVVRNKIVQEIPELLRTNGFENLEAKDILAMYMTATRFLKLRRVITDEEKTFAGVVIDRAIKHEPTALEQIFASIIAAVRELEHAP